MRTPPYVAPSSPTSATAGFGPAVVDARVKALWGAQPDLYTEFKEELPPGNPARAYRTFDELRAAAHPEAVPVRAESPSLWQRLRSSEVLLGIGGLTLMGGAVLLPAPALLAGAGTAAAAGLGVGAVKIHEGIAKWRLARELLDVSGNPQQRLDAVNKLIASEHPLKEAALKKALLRSVKEGDNDGIDQAAVKAMWGRLDEKTVLWLIKKTDVSIKEKTRLAAINSLAGSLHFPTAVKTLSRLLRDKNDEVRLAAFQTLSHAFDDPKILEDTLTAACDQTDSSYANETIAIFCTHARRLVGIIPGLIRILHNGKNMYFRHAASYYLAAFKDQDDVRTAFLQASETDGSEDVRKNAIRALNPFVENPEIEAHLLRRLQAEQTNEARAVIMDSLSRLNRRPNVVNVLIKIFWENPSSIRSNVIKSLSGSDDARAIELFEKILDASNALSKEGDSLSILTKVALARSRSAQAEPGG